MDTRSELRSPMLLPTLSIAGGVVLFEAGTGLGAGIAIIAAAIIIYMMLLRLTRTPAKSLRLNRYHRIWEAMLFVGIGISIAALQAPEEIDSDRLRGSVTERVAMTYGDRLTVKLDGYNSKVRIYAEPGDIRPGDIVEAKGELKRIADAGDKLPEGYAESMRRRGILYNLNVKKEGYVRKVGHRETISTFATRMRDDIDIFISHTPLRRDTKIFLSAMLIGDRTMLDQQKRQQFADAGVAHVLALSGMHLGIISLFLLGILLPANIFGLFKARYILTILILWGYAVLTGLSPTIVRASVMATCVMGGIILERKKSSLNALCTAVFIIILFDAMCIFDIGLQLSVACVGCLILFASKLNPVDHRSRPRLHSIAGAVIATLVATLGTWVITAWYFNRFPLLFLPVNLIVLPLLPWFAGGAIVYLLLYSFGIEITALGNCLDLAYTGFHSLAEWGGEAAVNVSIGGVTLVLWLYGLVVLAYGLHTSGIYAKGVRFTGIGVLMLALLTIFI